MYMLRAAQPTSHPSSIRHTRARRSHSRSLTHCSTTSLPPHALAHFFGVAPMHTTCPSQLGPRFAVLNGNCGLAPAHHEQAVQRPADLFHTLYSVLTDFLLFLAPRYGRARTAQAAIERGAEYGRSLVLFISCCNSSFTQVWNRLARVQSLTVNRSSRRFLAQSKPFIIFV